MVILGGWRGDALACCTLLNGWVSHKYKTPRSAWLRLDEQCSAKVLGLSHSAFPQGLGDLMVPVSSHGHFTAVPTLFCALAFLVLVDHGIPRSQLLTPVLFLPITFCCLFCSPASLFRRPFRGLFTGRCFALLLPDNCRFCALGGRQRRQVSRCRKKGPSRHSRAIKTSSSSFSACSGVTRRPCSRWSIVRSRCLYGTTCITAAASRTDTTPTAHSSAR